MIHFRGTMCANWLKSVKKPVAPAVVKVVDPVAERRKKTAKEREQRKADRLAGIVRVKTMCKPPAKLRAFATDEDTRRAYDLMFGYYDWS